MKTVIVYVVVGILFAASIYWRVRKATKSSCCDGGDNGKKDCANCSYHQPK